MAKTIDWRTLCQGDDGDYFDEEHVEYEFTDRKFKRREKPYYAKEEEE